MKYTNEQLKEIIKCLNDIEYFAENMTISTPFETKKLVLTDSQKTILEQISSERNAEIILDRQTGKSTAAALWILHNTMFNNYNNSVILGCRVVHSQEVLFRLMFMYDSLPDHLKIVKPIKRNKNSIKFDNGSRIYATSRIENFKGMAINNFYIDEFKYIKKYRESLELIYPVLDFSRGKILALSS